MESHYKPTPMQSQLTGTRSVERTREARPCEASKVSLTFIELMSSDASRKFTKPLQTAE